MEAVTFSDLIWPIGALYLHKRNYMPRYFDKDSNFDGPSTCFGGTWIHQGTITVNGNIYDAWYRDS